MQPPSFYGQNFYGPNLYGAAYGPGWNGGGCGRYYRAPVAYARRRARGCRYGYNGRRYGSYGRTRHYYGYQRGPIVRVRDLRRW